MTQTTPMTKPQEEVLLVQPQGYRLLVAIYKTKEKTEGGIIKPDELLAREDHAQTLGYVVALGPDCFQDEKRWPSKIPLCKEGDYIMFRSYAGTRFKLEGTDTEFRLLNDDAVEAVVMNPDRVKRAL
jgi:co-chaperonin GroES (HSP10)